MSSMPATIPKIDLTPTNSLLGGAPKGMYVWFLLALCKNYFEVLSSVDSTKYQIEHATAALVAFCPNTQKREALWKMYTELRDEAQNKSDIGPSVMTIGALVEYLSLTLEFEETSTGGLM